MLRMWLVKVKFSSFETIQPYSENLIRYAKILGKEIEIIRELTKEEVEEYMTYEKQMYGLWIEEEEKEFE